MTRRSDLTPQEIYENLDIVRDAAITSENGLSYSVVIPRATYSPWYESQDFQSAYQSVRLNTLVDIYRCHELWTLVGQLADIDGDIIEIGVWRGGTGCLMARATSKKVVLCDTFAGVVKAGESDNFYKGSEHADTSAQIVETLSAKLGLTNIEILQGVFPDETGKAVADRKFSLCHIDVDVYESARDILDWIWPRLSIGGAVVFDDYGFARCDGVTKLVNERMARPGAIFLHNLNGHAVAVKTSNAASSTSMPDPGR